MKGSRIIVASGKSGTGKTTVATSLAVSLMRGLPEVQFLDCDVEGPDAGLFLRSETVSSSVVTIKVPRIDPDKCSGCGQCQWVCQYDAVAMVSGKAHVSEDLCRGCGGCRLACPEEAATESDKRVGTIETGLRENLILHTGTLDVGQRVPLPVIEGLKAGSRSDLPTILDAAPGTGSAVIPALRDCDYCVLVTEPTPFGFYDLTLMMRVVDEFGIPAGIVLNKDDGRGSKTEEFAAERSLPILLRIPFSREIASLCSRGIVLTEADTSWDKGFWNLYEEVERAVWHT